MNIPGVQAYIQSERLVQNTTNRPAKKQQNDETENNVKYGAQQNQSNTQRDSHPVFTRNGKTMESYVPKGTLFDKVG